MVLAAGCRTAWPSPPTDEQRAQFGQVAVTVAPEVGDDMGRPVAGWPAGLGMGTLRGMWATVALALVGAGEGARCSHDDGAAAAACAGFIIGAAIGVLYTPVSIVAGAVSAPDRGEVARAEAVIRPIVGAPGFQEAFRDRFAGAAGWSFTSLEQAATVVELRLESVGGGSTWNWITFDRPFEVAVEASARVVRRSDGEVIWRALRRIPRPGDEPRRLTFVEWAANDGALLRAEIDHAIDRLARDFAWSIFVQRKGDPLPGPEKTIP
jgi:hypothetical protein